MIITDFDFELPVELIASYPLESRDESRMLVVPGNRDEKIKDFVSHLNSGDLLVLNNSRVIPVRFDAGGYEITLHTSQSEKVWWGLCKKFNRLNSGDFLSLSDGTKIEILDKDNDSGLKILFHTDDVIQVLNKVGKLPIPPYMNRETGDLDNTRYQTVYADPLGSMAAPTAGLHFTNEMLDEIRNIGVKIMYVTLHIGAGTWMPVKTKNLSQHKMHAEFGIITPEQANLINETKSKGGRVIAIGTTSLRLLESAATNKGVLPFDKSTDIFIQPGYEFKVVDILLTNFHLPKSTLLILVSAFAGFDEIKSAYKHAIDNNYRFFSYGDSCLLYKNKGKI